MNFENWKARYGFIFAGICGFVFFLSTVKPNEALTNIAGWLHIFGIDRIPSIIATASFDHLASWGSGLSTLLGALVAFDAMRRKPSIEPEADDFANGHVTKDELTAVETLKGPQYSYKKAVLQLKEAKVSATSLPDGTLTDIAMHIDIENHALVPLQQCRVAVVRIWRQGSEDKNQYEVRAAKARDGSISSIFNLGAGQRKRLQFISRDLKDVVSNPPFLLRLKHMEYPLTDPALYLIGLELRSEYEHPTLVKLKVILKARDQIDVEIVEQKI